MCSPPVRPCAGAILVARTMPVAGHRTWSADRHGRLWSNGVVNSRPTCKLTLTIAANATRRSTKSPLGTPRISHRPAATASRRVCLGADRADSVCRHALRHDRALHRGARWHELRGSLVARRGEGAALCAGGREVLYSVPFTTRGISAYQASAAAFLFHLL